MQEFTPDMTVEVAMAHHPKARWVFAAYHLSGCAGCASSHDETLAQVAAGYGIPLERLVGDLNSLLTS